VRGLDLQVGPQPRRSRFCFAIVLSAAPSSPMPASARPRAFASHTCGVACSLKPTCDAQRPAYAATANAATAYTATPLRCRGTSCSRTRCARS
jgi:hypothetical protein